MKTMVRLFKRAALFIIEHTTVNSNPYLPSGMFPTEK